MVTGLVPADIREESWMGMTQNYPNIRVHITRLSPIPVSSDCDTYLCEFSAAYRSANASSKPTADGLRVVIEALKGHKLALAGVFNSETSIILQDAPGPIPEAENAWMSRAFFTCRIKESPGFAVTCTAASWTPDNARLTDIWAFAAICAAASQAPDNADLAVT